MSLPTGLGEYTDDELIAEIQYRGYHVSAKKLYIELINKLGEINASN